jgi:hypothetical protein
VQDLAGGLVKIPRVDPEIHAARTRAGLATMTDREIVDVLNGMVATYEQLFTFLGKIVRR